jgi:hypothetical protein
MILLRVRMKKLLPYLILNIIVSAITMLIVLLVWDNAHPAQKQTQSAPILTKPAIQNTMPPETLVLPPLDQPVLEVQAVIVPGDLETERVLIRNAYSDPVSLQGWQVKNSTGDEYTFPVLTLYPGGSVSLYSRSGENTALELYWGLTRAAWKSGVKVTILDSQGNQRAEYSIP